MYTHTPGVLHDECSKVFSTSRMPSSFASCPCICSSVNTLTPPPLLLGLHLPTCTCACIRAYYSTHSNQRTCHPAPAAPADRPFHSRLRRPDLLRRKFPQSYATASQLRKIDPAPGPGLPYPFHTHTHTHAHTLYAVAYRAGPYPPVGRLLLLLLPSFPLPSLPRMMSSAAPPRIATSLHPGAWLGLDHHPETKEGQSIGATFLTAPKAHWMCRRQIREGDMTRTLTTTPGSPPNASTCRSLLPLSMPCSMSMVILHGAGSVAVCCSGCSHSFFFPHDQRAACRHAQTMYM